MVETAEKADVSALPLPPKSPLPYWRRVAALRAFHTGPEALRDAGGPVTRVNIGPRWRVLLVVVTTSPQGGRDTIGRTDAFIYKTRGHAEMRRLLGNNLFDVTHEAWLHAGARCNPSSPKSMCASLPVKCPVRRDDPRAWLGRCGD